MYSKGASTKYIGNFKHSVLSSMTKLGERDTHSTGSSELLAIQERLTRDTLPVYISCLCQVDSGEAMLIRKETVRILGELGQLLRENCFPYLSKMVAAVVKRLKDKDSLVRQAASHTMGLFAAYIVPQNDPSDSSLGPLFKPLFSCLSEQNKYLQVGAAMCVDQVLANGGGNVVTNLHRLAPRLLKFINHPNCLCRPELIGSVCSLLETCGENSIPYVPALLSAALDGIVDSDWHTRKASVELIEAFALNLGTSMSSFVHEIIDALENCRLDKVKPVREAVVEALQVYADVPDGEDVSTRQMIQDNDDVSDQVQDEYEKILKPQMRRVDENGNVINSKLVNQQQSSSHNSTDFGSGGSRKSMYSPSKTYKIGNSNHTGMSGDSLLQGSDPIVQVMEAENVRRQKRKQWTTQDPEQPLISQGTKSPLKQKTTSTTSSSKITSDGIQANTSSRWANGKLSKQRKHAWSDNSREYGKHNNELLANQTPKSKQLKLESDLKRKEQQRKLRQRWMKSESQDDEQDLEQEQEQESSLVQIPKKDWDNLMASMHTMEEQNQELRNQLEKMETANMERIKSLENQLQFFLQAQQQQMMLQQQQQQSYGVSSSNSMLSSPNQSMSFSFLQKQNPFTEKAKLQREAMSSSSSSSSNSSSHMGQASSTPSKEYSDSLPDDDGAFTKALNLLVNDQVSDAFNIVLQFGDELQLIRLVNRTGPVLQELELDTICHLFSKFIEFLQNTNFVDSIFPWVQQAIELSVPFPDGLRYELATILEEISSAPNGFGVQAGELSHAM